MVIALPEVIYSTTVILYEDGSSIYMNCTYSWPTSHTTIYQLFIVFITFVLPFILMTISYWHIVEVLWRNEAISDKSELSSICQANSKQKHRQRVRGLSQIDKNNSETTTTCLGKQDKMFRPINNNNDNGHEQAAVIGVNNTQIVHQGRKFVSSGSKSVFLNLNSSYNWKLRASNKKKSCRMEQGLGTGSFSKSKKMTNPRSRSESVTTADCDWIKVESHHENLEIEQQEQVKEAKSISKTINEMAHIAITVDQQQKEEQLEKNEAYDQGEREPNQRCKRTQSESKTYDHHNTKDHMTPATRTRVELAGAASQASHLEPVVELAMSQPKGHLLDEICQSGTMILGFTRGGLSADDKDELHARKQLPDNHQDGRGLNKTLTNNKGSCILAVKTDNCHRCARRRRRRCRRCVQSCCLNRKHSSGTDLSTCGYYYNNNNIDNNKNNSNCDNQLEPGLVNVENHALSSIYPMADEHKKARSMPSTPFTLTSHSSLEIGGKKKLNDLVGTRSQYLTSASSPVSEKPAATRLTNNKTISWENESVREKRSFLEGEELMNEVVCFNELNLGDKSCCPIVSHQKQTEAETLGASGDSRGQAKEDEQVGSLRGLESSMDHRSCNCNCRRLPLVLGKEDVTNGAVNNEIAIVTVCNWSSLPREIVNRSSREETTTKAHSIRRQVSLTVEQPSILGADKLAGVSSSSLVKSTGSNESQFGDEMTMGTATDRQSDRNNGREKSKHKQQQDPKIGKLYLICETMNSNTSNNILANCSGGDSTFQRGSRNLIQQQEEPIETLDASGQESGSYGRSPEALNTVGERAAIQFGSSRLDTGNVGGLSLPPVHSSSGSTSSEGCDSFKLDYDNKKEETNYNNNNNNNYIKLYNNKSDDHQDHGQCNGISVASSSINEELLAVDKRQLGGGPTQSCNNKIDRRPLYYVSCSGLAASEISSSQSEKNWARNDSMVLYNAQLQSQSRFSTECECQSAGHPLTSIDHDEFSSEIPMQSHVFNSSLLNHSQNGEQCNFKHQHQEDEMLTPIIKAEPESEHHLENEQATQSIISSQHLAAIGGTSIVKMDPRCSSLDNRNNNYFPSQGANSSSGGQAARSDQKLAANFDDYTDVDHNPRTMNPSDGMIKFEQLARHQNVEWARKIKQLDSESDQLTGQQAEVIQPLATTHGTKRFVAAKRMEMVEDCELLVAGAHNGDNLSFCSRQVIGVGITSASDGPICYGAFSVDHMNMNNNNRKQFQAKERTGAVVDLAPEEEHRSLNALQQQHNIIRGAIPTLVSSDDNNAHSDNDNINDINDDDNSGCSRTHRPHSHSRAQSVSQLDEHLNLPLDCHCIDFAPTGKQTQSNQGAATKNKLLTSSTSRDHQRKLIRKSNSFASLHYRRQMITKFGTSKQTCHHRFVRSRPLPNGCWSRSEAPNSWLRENKLMNKGIQGRARLPTLNNQLSDETFHPGHAKMIGKTLPSGRAKCVSHCPGLPEATKKEKPNICTKKQVLNIGFSDSDNKQTPDKQRTSEKSNSKMVQKTITSQFGGPRYRRSTKLISHSFEPSQSISSACKTNDDNTNLQKNAISSPTAPIKVPQGTIAPSKQEQLSYSGTKRRLRAINKCTTGKRYISCLIFGGKDNKMNSNTPNSSSHCNNNHHIPGAQNNNNQHNNNHNNHNNSQENANANSNANRFCKLIESRRKAAKMLIVIVIMFGLCFLPIHFLNLLR